MTTEIDEKTAVQALIKIVEDYAMERRRPGGGYDLPEGLVLEMHPRVMHAVMRNWMPGYSDLVSGQQTPFLAQIPVKISPDLPDNTWRLAVITAEVINGGEMPGA